MLSPRDGSGGLLGNTGLLKAVVGCGVSVTCDPWVVCCNPGGGVMSSDSEIHPVRVNINSEKRTKIFLVGKK